MNLYRRTIFSVIIWLCSLSVYGQVRDTTQQDYLIRTTKINFHFGEQNYPYTLFIEPKGRFYFKENFVKGEPLSRIVLDSKKNKRGTNTFTRYKDVFKPTTDSIVTVESLYPKFIKHDSSFIGQNTFDYELMPLIYELAYSFLLDYFGEPSLFTSDNKKAIRVIMPAEGIEHPGRYEIYRLEFGKEQSILIYKEGEFDSTGTFKVLNSSTCIVNDKSRLNVEKTISKIDFEKEYYFLKANLDSEFFIEYRNGEDYYAIQRSSSRGKYVGIYLSLYSASVKCGE